MSTSSTSRSTRSQRVAGTLLATALAAGSAVALAGPASAASFTKIQGAAGGAAGLQGTVDAYRSLLGADNGSTPGSVGSGRREIDWDAVPDAISSPNLMPRDLFNTAVPRGAVFSSPAGGRFEVSASVAGPAPERFGTIHAQYPTIFGTFSPEKLFTPRGTTQTRVTFFVPGTATPAYVNGFGAVFTDVDLPDSSRIDVYDRWGAKLWGGKVPKGPRASKSLSFLGVKGSARIHEVRITTGNRTLAPNHTDGAWSDLVVLDDLVYGEPKAY
jgi:hypothetical protein